MAATYKELYDLLADADLIKRVKFAFMHIARDLRAENPTTPNHENRKVFADRVLTQTLQKVSINHQMVEILVSPSLLANGAAATDSDLFSAANAAIDRLVAMETQ